MRKEGAPLGVFSLVAEVHGSTPRAVGRVPGPTRPGFQEDPARVLHIPPVAAACRPALPSAAARRILTSFSGDFFFFFMIFGTLPGIDFFGYFEGFGTSV